MDILFRNEYFVFSYRVAGVLQYNGRWLLQKSPKDEGYAFVGGHVAFGETNEETLRREFLEELGQKVTVGRLIAVGEVFFPWGDKPCHQICLYYELDFDGLPSIPICGIFHGFDELGGERVDLDFCWIEQQRMPKIPVYPPQIVAHLLNEDPQVLHFVYREE